MQQQQSRTDSERLAVIEEILNRIEGVISQHVQDDRELEKRIDRLERAWAYAAGGVAVVLFLFKFLSK